MIEIVERFKNDPTAEPCAKLYFGHAETVVPLISLLGLFEGPPLTAEGFLLSKHRFVVQLSSIFKNNWQKIHFLKILFTWELKLSIGISFIKNLSSRPLKKSFRSFRSSAIVPYSSNIGFLIYRKLDSNSDSDMPEMLLQISVNEHLVNIPGTFNFFENLL